MIHVCFGLYDATGRYSKFTGTCMLSIFKNTVAPVTVHILYDDSLTPDNRDKFLQVTDRFNQRVNFYNVDELCADDIKFLRAKLADKIKLRFSIGAFYRLLVKKILAPRGIRKTIYLDSDIIVNLDIAELWRHDLQNFPLAAVPETVCTHDHVLPGKFLIVTGRVRLENYFCSGVMIIDLEKLADDFFADGVQFLADNPACDTVDQDILNAFFSTNYLKLENKFDAFVALDRAAGSPFGKKIYHYAGNAIGFDYSDAFNRLWLDCFMQTPWLDGEMFARINDAFREKYLELYQLMKNSLAQLSATVSDKARGFFIMSGDSDALKKIFAIRDDEEIIFADTNNALPKLVAAMGKASGKKIFFLVVPDFDAVSNILQQIDFVPDKDFLDGSNFVMQKKDWKFYSFPLLKAM